MRKIIQLLSIWLLSGAPALGSEETAVFHYFVESAEGEIFAWSNLEVGWARVKPKSRLADGVLVQSAGAMRIQAVRTNEGSRARGQRIVIESQSPVMFRFSPALSRDFELGNFFVRKTIDTEGLGPKKEDEYLTLRDAWEKVLAIVKSGSSKTDGGDSMKFGKGQEQQVQAEVEGALFELNYPAKGSVFVPDQFPVEVPVTWELPTAMRQGGSRDFEVYFKQTTESEYTFAGKTKDSALPLMIEKEGSYALYVKSSDGKMRSEEILFSVYPAEAEIWKQNKPQRSPIPKTVH